MGKTAIMKVDTSPKELLMEELKNSKEIGVQNNDTENVKPVPDFKIRKENL